MIEPVVVTGWRGDQLEGVTSTQYWVPSTQYWVPSTEYPVLSTLCPLPSVSVTPSPLAGYSHPGRSGASIFSHRCQQRGPWRQCPSWRLGGNFSGLA
jgi:hypothetical protein